MKRLLLLIPVVVLTTAGCTFVTCNHVFPQPAFVWSREAIDCRKQRQAEKQFQQHGFSNAEMEESADTVIRLRQQMGKPAP